MSRPVALIRAAALLGFDELVRRLGKEPDQLMAAAGLSNIYLREQDMYVPLQRYMNLLEISAEETKNPLFGADLGFHQSIRSLGTFAYAIASCATVGSALETLIHLYRMFATGVLLRLEHFDSKVMLSAVIIVPAPKSSRQMMGYFAAAGTEIMRTFLGRSWKADEVHFSHSVEYAERKLYRQMLGGSITFNAEKTALVFDAKVLSMPLPGADPALHELVKRQVYAVNHRLLDDLVLQVEANIRRAMPHGDVSLESVAKSLAMSQRSLQRHLGDNGTSFQELLDATRQQAAEHYLLNSSLQLTQITALLGFKAQANFSHAFRRWHGVSPREWRKSHL